LRANFILSLKGRICEEEEEEEENTKLQISIAALMVWI
jgi:hypothetical protein